MVVRMRHTRAHTANRRSHHALTGARLSACAKCKSAHLMHHACDVCGTYRGKTVTNVLKKTEKKVARTAKKAEAKGK